MWRDGPGQAFKTVHRITGKNGNTLTIEPPLPYTLSSGLNPTAEYVPWNGATLCGVENMTLNSTAGANNIIEFWYADRCWVKGVEAYNAGNAFIFTDRSLQCEVRRCFIHHPIGSPNNSDGYGIYFYDASTYCLAEDNIFYETWSGILSSASSCNAALYNYFWKMMAYDLSWTLPA
jgi:hypothetical protein